MNDITYEQFFATISGGSRLKILQSLKQNSPQNVSEIADSTGLEQSAVSHGLKKLLACQCVHIEIRGKNRYYSLNSTTIVPLLELVDQHIDKFCQSNCQHCSRSTK